MSGLVKRLVVMLILNIVLAVAAVAGGGMAAWFLLGCCLFLTVFGATSSLLVVGDMQIERVIEEVSFSSGGSLKVTGTVQLPFRFPLAFAVIRDEWTNTRNQYAVQGAVLLLPMGKRELSFSYVIPRMARGVYQLSRVETTAGDLLHLSGYRTVSRILHAEPVIVYPEARHELEQIGAGTMSPDQMFHDSLKRYEDGDSARRIDWKSYVRTGELMTRLSDGDEQPGASLVLDPGMDEAAFERVIAVAAGFIERNLAVVDHGLALYCGTTLSLEGERNYYTFMEKLAMLDRGSASAFRPSIAEAIASMDRGGAVVVVIGSMEQRVLDTIREAGQMAELTILYASAKRVMNAQERAVAEELMQEGHDFEFVPGPTALSPIQGVPALG